MVSLRELNLQTTAVTDASIKSLLTLTALRKLDVFDNPQLSAARLSDVKAMPNLRKIKFKTEDHEVYRALRRAFPGVAISR
jgi:hypothetical protein